MVSSVLVVEERCDLEPELVLATVAVVDTAVAEAERPLTVDRCYLIDAVGLVVYDFLAVEMFAERSGRALLFAIVADTAVVRVIVDVAVVEVVEPVESAAAEADSAELF